MLQDSTTLKLTSSPTRPRTRQSRTDTFASDAEIETSSLPLVDLRVQPDVAAQFH